MASVSSLPVAEPAAEVRDSVPSKPAAIEAPRKSHADRVAEAYAKVRVEHASTFEKLAR